MLKRNKVSMLVQGYILEILVLLSETPKMFKDLSASCPNERTRSKKLKILADAGLVTTIAQKTNKRYFIHYVLTEKGRKVAYNLCKLKEILENK
jgi:DNA-binding HxlR family transcriptional regulator